MSRDVRGNRNHPDLLTRPRVDEKNALANVRPPTTPASRNKPQALRNEPDTRLEPEVQTAAGVRGIRPRRRVTPRLPRSGAAPCMTSWVI